MKLRKSIISIFMATTLLLTACGTDDNSSDVAKVDANAKGNTVNVELKNGDKIAIFKIKDFGEIKAKLFPDVAPIGVENFIKLAESGYYTDKKIHRVISDFMIQGGSLNGDGSGGLSADGGTFGVEAHPNAVHIYGALSYANAGGKNTCQFFIINSKESQTPEHFNVWESKLKGKKWSDSIKKLYEEKGGSPFLDGDYTVFGQTYEGLDVLDAISAVNVANNGRGEISKPVKEIIIESVTIEIYGDKDTDTSDEAAETQE